MVHSATMDVGRGVELVEPPGRVMRPILFFFHHNTPLCVSDNNKRRKGASENQWLDLFEESWTAYHCTALVLSIDVFEY